MVSIADYMELLINEKFAFEISDRFDALIFQRDGARLALEHDEQDPAYLRIRLVIALEEPVDEAATLRALNGMNERCKGVKGFANFEERLVSFSIESLYSDAAHVTPNFSRLLKFLDRGSDFFYKALAEDD